MERANSFFNFQQLLISGFKWCQVLVQKVNTGHSLQSL